MKLVIIASRFPYPLEKGDKLRLFYQIKSLASTFDIYLFSLSDMAVSKESHAELSKYCKEIHIFRINGKKNAFKGLLNARPFQVNYFYDKKAHHAMRRRIAQIQPNHIYYQLIRTTEYSFDKSYSKSVDLMDCFSKGYQLRGLKEKALRKKFYDAEARRLTAYEDMILNTFTNKFIISEQDKAELLKRKSTDIAVLSNGIDTAYFTPEKKEKIYDIAFVGNMGYEPNIYAVQYLIDSIIPALNANVKTLIAGARPSAQLKARASEKLTVSGWMQDIRDAYKQSKLFLAPIRDGIGQQNKILEAMAMEIPCVVSEEVATGLDIEHVKDFLFIADSKQEYLNYVNGILDGSIDTDARTNDARKYIQKHRSWDAVNAILSEKIMEIIRANDQLA